MLKYVKIHYTAIVGLGNTFLVIDRPAAADLICGLVDPIDGRSAGARSSADDDRYRAKTTQRARANIVLLSTGLRTSISNIIYICINSQEDIILGGVVAP